MHSQPIGTYPRCFIDLLSLVFVFKSTTDHPPPNSTLDATKSEHSNQGVSQFWHDVTSREKVRHRAKKYDSDGPAYYSVEPFPKENVLEAVNIHTLVDIDLQIFWSKLINNEALLYIDWIVKPHVWL